MDGAGLHGRRPRPVADTPAVDASALAKAWLLTLVAGAPLQQVAAVPAADLARSGPAFCGAVLRALASDAELDRLVGPGPEGGAPPASAAARLTGARTPAAVAAGVEALRAAASRALREALRDPVPELVADLGDRLAYVCARVAESALADRPVEAARRAGPLAGALAASRAGDGGGAGPNGGGQPAAPGRPAAAAGATTPPPSADPDAAPPAGVGGPPPGVEAVEGLAPSAGVGGPPPGVEAVEGLAPSAGVGGPPSGVEAVEGLAPSAGVGGPPPGVEVVEGLGGPSPGVDPLASLEEALAAGPPEGLPAATPPAPVPGGPTVTRVRRVDTSWDDAAQSGPPWLASIERRLERRREDGLPFAVLVAEVDDLDRLVAAQSGREVGLALESAERGLTAELAPADLVVRERLGRWWLLSPDRDAAAARGLAERVAAAIRHAVLAGAPLSVSIGVAVCPDDGETVDDLAGRADEGMFAARAAGVPVA